MFLNKLSFRLSSILIMQTNNSSSYSKFLFNKAYINGEWCESHSRKTFQVINPADGTSLGSLPNCDENDTKRAIEAATKAFESWSTTTAKSRSILLRKLYEAQLTEQQGLAELMTKEMGKPIRESLGEINYGASFIEWFAEEARRMNGEIIQSPWQDKMIMYFKQPVGPVGIITPWNFPNAMITRKLGAVLAAGCTAVIKPPSQSPFSALAIAKLAEKIGFPKGVINVVTSASQNASKVGETLCKSPDIMAISFTGSTSVGKVLLEQASSTVKKVALELGGNAPFIVFDSANVDSAVRGCLASKFRNSGQTCVCANRIFVQSGIHDRFVAKLTEVVSKELIVGDGIKPETTVGPLVNSKAADKVKEHIDDAVSKGGKIVYGGKDFQGNFVPPTIITNINEKMICCYEETFGPLAPIVKFETEDQVISLANSTRFGLAGYFYSNDNSQIWRVAKKLQVGIIGINEGIISCCEGPFGGVKESGLGREGSKFGIDEFTEIKYICLGGLE